MQLLAKQLEASLISWELQAGVSLYKMMRQPQPIDSFLVGLIYTNLEQKELATQAFEKALSNGLVGALAGIAMLHRQSNNLASAWAALEGVNTARLSPLEATIFHRENAELAWRVSRLNDATNHIQTALRISRLDETVNQIMTASLCLTSAAIHSMIGQEEIAFEHASEGLAVAAVRRRPFLLYRRIISSINLERFENAKTDLAELQMWPTEMYNSPDNLTYARAKLAEAQNSIKESEALYKSLLQSECNEYKVHAFIALDRLDRRNNLNPSPQRQHIDQALKITGSQPRLENLTRLAALAVPNKTTETAPIAASALETQGQQKDAVLAWLYAMNAGIIQENWDAVGFALSQAERLKRGTDYTLNLELAGLPRVRLYLASLGHPWSIRYCQNPNVSDLEIILAHNDTPPINPAHPYHAWDYHALNEIDRIIALALNSRAAVNHVKRTGNHHLFYLRNHASRILAFRLAANQSHEIIELGLHNPKITNQTDESLTVAFTEKTIVFSNINSYMGLHILDIQLREPPTITAKDPISHVKYKFIIHNSKSIIWQLVKLQS
jgi:hypothetical protein